MPRSLVPRQPRAVATNAEVMHAAEELFREHGYDRTSVELICERCHVSRGAFYYHFASKEDLLVALAMRDGAALDGAFELLMRSDGTTLEVLAASLRLFCRGLAAHPRRDLPFVLQEMVRAWTADPPMPPGLRVRIAAVLERAAARGELPGGWSVDELSATIFGTALATVIEWLADGEASADDLEARTSARAAALLVRT